MLHLPPQPQVIDTSFSLGTSSSLDVNFFRLNELGEFGGVLRDKGYCRIVLVSTCVYDRTDIAVDIIVN